MISNGVMRVRSLKAYAQIVLIFILMFCVAYMALKSNQVSDNRKRLPRRLSPIVMAEKTTTTKVTLQARKVTKTTIKTFVKPPKLTNAKNDNRKYTLVSYDDIKSDKSKLFDIDNPSDYIVFLHIQKTGGSTFGQHLARDLGKCKCRTKASPRFCKCLRKNKKQEPPTVTANTTKRNRPMRPQGLSRFAGSSRIGDEWLFSRYNLGWPCGVHAGWAQMETNGCVDRRIKTSKKSALASPSQRRYFYVTMLRDPVSRYLSEWKHIISTKGGVTWQSWGHMEKCKNATVRHACYPAKLTRWLNVTLEEFMSCQDNHAANRQAWMLADTDRITCDMNPVQVDKVLLESAKENLLKMAFIGITEMQEESRLVFEDTFKMKFLKKFSVANATLAGHAKNGLNEAVIDDIVKINKIDMELYEFARAILKERFELI